MASDGGIHWHEPLLSVQTPFAALDALHVTTGALYVLSPMYPNEHWYVVLAPTVVANELADIQMVLAGDGIVDELQYAGIASYRHKVSAYLLS